VKPSVCFLVVSILCAGVFPVAIDAVTWHQGSYNTGDWPEGFAPLGFGTAGVRTAIPAHRPAYYFRNLFYLPSTVEPAMTELVITVLTGEGVIVHFNGVEAGRSPWLPQGELDYETLSSHTDPSGVQTFDLTGVLSACENSIGENWRPVTVELHRMNPDAPLLFDAFVSAEREGFWERIVQENEEWLWNSGIGKPETHADRPVGGIRYPLTGMPALISPGNRFHILTDTDVDPVKSVFVLSGTRNSVLLEDRVIGSLTDRGREIFFDLPSGCVPGAYTLFVFNPSGDGTPAGQSWWHAPQSVAVLPAMESSLSIVHITDSHLPYRGWFYPDTTEPLDRIWSGLPSLQPDLVIHTGDGYNEGNFRDQAALFQTFLDSCPSAVAYVGGNHELGEWCGDGGSREHYWDLFGWPQLDPRVSGHWSRSTRDFVIDAGPVSLVCVETWTSYTSFWDAWYPWRSLTYDQIDWMRTVSNERPDQYLVACYHHDFSGQLEYEVMPIFGYSMGLSGHTHTEEEYSLGPIQFYKTGSTYQASRPLRWFHFKNGSPRGGNLLIPNPVDIQSMPADTVPAVERTVTVRNHEFSDIPGHRTWIPMVQGNRYTVSGTGEFNLLGQWSGGGVDWVCVEQDLESRALMTFQVHPEQDPGTFDNYIVFECDDALFRAGETTRVKAILLNEGAGKLVTVYIAFEAGGMYFFWPGWTAAPEGQTLYLSENLPVELPILEVIWPDLPVLGETVTFYAVILDNRTGESLSPVAGIDLFY
jgi:hypothetical protein